MKNDWVRVTLRYEDQYGNFQGQNRLLLVDHREDQGVLVASTLGPRLVQSVIGGLPCSVFNRRLRGFIVETNSGGGSSWEKTSWTEQLFGATSTLGPPGWSPLWRLSAQTDEGTVSRYFWPAFWHNATYANPPVIIVAVNDKLSPRNLPVKLLTGWPGPWDAAEQELKYAVWSTKTAKAYPIDKVELRPKAGFQRRRSKRIVIVSPAGTNQGTRPFIQPNWLA